jgi:hypothetical protein
MVGLRYGKPFYVKITEGIEKKAGDQRDESFFPAGHLYIHDQPLIKKKWYDA